MSNKPSTRSPGIPKRTSPATTWKFGADDIGLQDLLATLNVVEYGTLAVIEEIDKDLPEE